MIARPLVGSAKTFSLRKTRLHSLGGAMAGLVGQRRPDDASEHPGLSCSPHVEDTWGAGGRFFFFNAALVTTLLAEPLLFPRF